MRHIDLVDNDTLHIECANGTIFTVKQDGDQVRVIFDEGTKLDVSGTVVSVADPLES